MPSASGFELPVLEGYGYRLEPLSLSHEVGLRVAAADGELWRLRHADVPTPEHMRRMIDEALRHYQSRTRVPFAVLEASSGRVVGSTAYCDFVPSTERLDIGHHWLAQSAQRTAANTACLLLLLSYAFESLGAQTVGMRCDVLNRKAQVAIDRVGFKLEGVLSRASARKDSTPADAVLYAMAVADWPQRKAKLVERLARGTAAAPAFKPKFLPLRQLKADQVNTLARLDPGPAKARYIAPNGVTIAHTIGHQNAHLIALLSDQTPVGMLLIYDPTSDPDEAQADGVAEDTLVLWRLMVDFRHQGKGYGGAALDEFLRQATLRPGIRQLRLSHLPGEGSAAALFEAHGFAYNGERDGQELVMTRQL